MRYGFFSRKNWETAETGLVTSSHVTGGVRSGVECSVNPAAFAHQPALVPACCGVFVLVLVPLPDRSG